MIGWSSLDFDYLQYPWAFVAAYTIAATLCLWNALDFSNPQAVALAGGAMITVNVANGLVLVAGKAADLDGFDDFTVKQIIVGTVKWWLLAFLIAVLFFRRVTPLASEQRLKD